MQWTNESARKALCRMVYRMISDVGKIDETREIFLRYLGPWKKQVSIRNVKNHFHGLGCYFLQSAIGLKLPFKFKNNKWSFDSWVEYKVEPLKIEELPCPCMWAQDKCLVIRKSTKLKSRLNKICSFFSILPRRLDLCWIEKSLLDNMAITAEVEVSKVIKQDLAKVHTIFLRSAHRGKRGFDEPILHIQMDLSGRNQLEEVVSFMKKYWSKYPLSPSIIYIAQQSKFKEWIITHVHRGRVLKSKVLSSVHLA